MKSFLLLLLSVFAGSTLADFEIDISLPVSTVPTSKLQDCICAAIVTEVSGIEGCTFEGRRMEEEEAVNEGDRDLQSNPCASCNPGPSGAICRWMYCRRRLGESISVALPGVAADVEACAELSGTVVVDLTVA
jgi:hypothetical protein